MTHETPEDIFAELREGIEDAKRQMMQEVGHVVNFALVPHVIETRLVRAGVVPKFESMEFGPVWHFGTVEGVAVVSHVCSLVNYLSLPLGHLPHALADIDGKRDEVRDWVAMHYLGGRWWLFAGLERRLKNMTFSEAVEVLASIPRDKSRPVRKRGEGRLRLWARR